MILGDIEVNSFNISSEIWERPRGDCWTLWNHFGNPFWSSIAFLYPLKRSEDLWFFDVFRGYRFLILGENGLMCLLEKQHTLQLMSFVFFSFSSTLFLEFWLKADCFIWFCKFGDMTDWSGGISGCLNVYNICKNVNFLHPQKLWLPYFTNRIDLV